MVTIPFLGQNIKEKLFCSYKGRTVLMIGEQGFNKDKPTYYHGQSVTPAQLKFSWSEFKYQLKAEQLRDTLSLEPE